MMKFTALASGSKGNSFLLEDDGTKVLIDCGTTKKYLLEALHSQNTQIDDLDALVITHDHSDHISQIRHFQNVDIYSPVEIQDIETFRVRPLQNFTIHTLEFTPIPLSHDAYHTTGYIISNGVEKLVYVTDTGYVNQRYIPLMLGADWIVMESNHDVDMLMHSRRPQFLKQRIYGDDGHLNNEQCADVLNQIVTDNTKMILLAHISQEANTQQKALEVTKQMLLQEHTGKLNKNLVVCALGQYEIVHKGENDEEMDRGCVSWIVSMEHHTDI